MQHIFIPRGIFSTQDDDAAAMKRRELRNKLLRGEEVKVSPNGHVMDASQNRNQDGIIVPQGKLASFYWYERDKNLLKGEREAMRKFFPQFKQDILPDGRMCWYGNLETDLRSGGRWYLQAIYDHNHPSNSTYGGSVRVYSIDPDLEEVQDKLGETIPHLLRDSKSNVYLCTARKEDVTTGRVVTSAASSLSWAAKWIASFEMWMAGDLATSEFAGHSI